MQLLTLHICRVKYTQMILLHIDRVDHIPSLVRLDGLPVIRLVKHRHGHWQVVHLCVCMCVCVCVCVYIYIYIYIMPNHFRF